jgi:hypothetical protein
VKNVKDFAGEFNPPNKPGSPKPDVNNRAKPNKNHPAVPQFAASGMKPVKR